MPVATVELKTDFTQSVDDAIDQYRFDRLPGAEGPGAEPLLTFPSGALVHFAVSNSDVHMTTRLDGPRHAVPALQPGRPRRGKGNPVNPRRASHRLPVGAGLGARELAGDPRPLSGGRSATRRSRSRAVIFPRYHQLDATRKLLAAVLHDGPGGKYLIQHSAGSGKTNSIAWTAHFLADLHDAQQQEAVRLGARGVRPQRDRLRSCRRRSSTSSARPAWWPPSRATSGSKSARAGRGALRRQEDRRLHHPDVPVRAGSRARAGGHQGQAVRRDRRRGAQLADGRGGGQAQGGAVAPRNWPSWTTAARSARKTCWPRRWRHAPTTPGITFVAFTATPKTKTLELFGTRPDPTRPAGAGQPAGALPRLLDAPGHRGGLHPRRAAELHALQAGVQAGARRARRYDDQEVERSAAMKRHHGLGAAAPLQHRAEGADRRRALPRARRAAAGRPGQGDGGGRQPQGGGALASWRSTSTSQTAATRSARWWRSRAR